MIVRTQGLEYPNEMTVDMEAQCGKITDGICFHIHDYGAWVISFESLRSIYVEACRVRGRKRKVPNPPRRQHDTVGQK